jgi:hypothetical protein
LVKKKKCKSKKKECWGLPKEERKELGRTWAREFTEEGNIIRAYSKKFGLNLKNSMKELRRIGFKISNQDKEEIKRILEKQAEQKKKRKKKALKLEESCYSDENFAFIAGYTEGGLPFGITHEEMEEIEKE